MNKKPHAVFPTVWNNAISTKHFSVDKNTKTLCAEASTLNATGFDVKPVFYDAIDEGFVLESHVTGAKIVWTLSKSIFSKDREVIGWEFVPFSREDSIKGWKVVVIND